MCKILREKLQSKSVCYVIVDVVFISGYIVGGGATTPVTNNNKECEDGEASREVENITDNHDESSAAEIQKMDEDDSNETFELSSCVKKEEGRQKVLFWYYFIKGCIFCIVFKLSAI